MSSALVKTEMGMQVVRKVPGMDREWVMPSEPVGTSTACDHTSVEARQAGQAQPQGRVFRAGFFAGMKLDD